MSRTCGKEKKSLTLVTAPYMFISNRLRCRWSTGGREANWHRRSASYNARNTIPAMV